MHAKLVPALSFACLIAMPGAQAKDTGTEFAERRLSEQEPCLASLYAASIRYRAMFSDYARQQGFRRPFEHLATVVHELIHVASATRQGYFVDCRYYEPYLAPEAWPRLRNRDVAPYVQPREKGNIYQQYFQVNPQNGMANLLDEINAYGHILGFVCRNEPASCRSQGANLLGHLELLEASLRAVRTAAPDQYAALAGHRAAGGALRLIVGRAYVALRKAGVAQAGIPIAEAALAEKAYLAAHPELGATASP